jgi:quercetin dioxygenase-like cupin family protein
MKVVSILTTAASLVLVSASFAQEPPAKKSKTAGTAAARLVAKPAADLTWSDLDPKGAPGVRVADLWGNHSKGSFGAYFKLPAGFAVPLHTHTHDMKVIFVSGTYIQQPEGKPEFRLGPGSYMMQPGGTYRHTTSCDKGSECVFFVEGSGAFDLKLVETTKPSGK